MGDLANKLVTEKRKTVDTDLSTDAEILMVNNPTVAQDTPTGTDPTKRDEVIASPSIVWTRLFQGLADARFATTAQGALADSAFQTGAEVKAAYESEADTNAFTDADHSKLDGIATGATANATDANLRDRATHTGAQAINTITGLQGALDGKSATGHTHGAEDIVSGTFADARIQESSVTQHEAALDVTNMQGYVVVPQINDSAASPSTLYSGTQIEAKLANKIGNADIVSPNANNALSNPGNGVFLDSAALGGGGGAVTSVNGEIGAVTLTHADVGAAAALHTHGAGDITSGVFANARIQESNVTQHEAALDIANMQSYGALNTSVSDNAADIVVHTSQISDHETRITALETSDPTPPPDTDPTPTVNLPIRPNATGFGMVQAAGTGRNLTTIATSFHYVTNTNTSGAGSLPHVIANLPTDGSPWNIVFETSGVCDLSGSVADLSINKPNGCIWGQTAPGKGFMVYGARLALEASNLYVGHFRCSVGDAVGGLADSERDSVILRSPDGVTTISNIVLDHCGFYWSKNYVVNTGTKVENVTVWDCLFGEALGDSTGRGMLVGANNFSLFNSIMHSCDRRIPEILSPNAYFANMLCHNSFFGGVVRDHTAYSQYSSVSQASYTFNGCIRTNGPTRPDAGAFIIQFDPITGASRQAFIENEFSQNYGGAWPGVTNDVNATRLAAQPIEFPTYTVADVSTEAAALAQIAAMASKVGPFSYDRAEWETRMMSELPTSIGNPETTASGSGSRKTTVASAVTGSIPAIATTTRTLTDLRAAITDDSYNDIQLSGYTKFEEIIHAYQNTVEAATVSSNVGSWSNTIAFTR